MCTEPSTSLLAHLYLAGTAVFAMSGALAAARAHRTPLTFAFFAVITAVGGNTVSELLMGAPVSWVHHPTSIVVCLGVAFATWVTPLAWWPARAIDWFDAIGIAAYGVIGAANALAYDIAPLAAVIMGIFTACLGGVLRDVLGGQPSMIIRPELYITAAALAAGAYIVLDISGMEPASAAAAAFAMGFGLRALAIVKKLSLPSYLS